MPGLSAKPFEGPARKHRQSCCCSKKEGGENRNQPGGEDAGVSGSKRSEFSLLIPCCQAGMAGFTLVGKADADGGVVVEAKVEAGLDQGDIAVDRCIRH